MGAAGPQERGMGVGIWVAVLCAVLAVPLLTTLAPELTSEVSVGIDLGTTFSVVAVCQHGQVSVVEVDGSVTTPSVVSYAAPPRGATVVGAAAAALRAVRPRHTVHDAKRLIGRLADDPVVLAEAAHLPFAVVPDARGFAAVALPSDGAATPPISPEAVGAALLRHLKASAERSKPLRHAMGFRFGSATISVPVGFSTRQRSATLAAGRAAGFRLVRLLDEPVAAALAYGLTQADKERTVLVYDMGGGTLDVAILRLELASRTFLVMAAAGDPHLGGEDFDRALAAWAREAAPDGVGAADDANAGAALLVACEAAKRALGTGSSAQLALPSGDSLTLTRAAADAAVAPLLERALTPVDAALREAGMGADDVDDVVLVGGATRLEALRERVGAAFHGRALHTEVDPDTAIATAVDALLHAAAADGDGSALLERCIADVMSLGAELGLDRVGPAAWNTGTFQGHALQGDLRRVLSAPLTLPALSFGLFSAPPGKLTLLSGPPSRIIKGASGRSRQPRAAGRDPDSRPDRYAVQTPFILQRAGRHAPLRGVNTAVGSFSVGWADDAPRELHVAFSHVRLALTRAEAMDDSADSAADAALLGVRERELPEPACATLRVLLMTPTVAVTRSDQGNVAVLTRCDAM